MRKFNLISNLFSGDLKISEDGPKFLGYPFA